MSQNFVKEEPLTFEKRRLPPIVFILAGLVLVGVLSLRKGDPITPQGPRSPQARMSMGDKILVAAGATPEKQAGVEAFADRNLTSARIHFQSSLQKHRNDPETLIYLNNANVGKDSFKIAVSIPISSNPNVAQEILRGVAQAQDEANRTILSNSGLQVQIVDDENSPDIVREVAAHLVSDSTILAVVGHNASDASLAAAPVYQQGGLVMISPTSFVNQLSGFGNYIFRTAPAIRFMADPLAEYVVKSAQKTNIALCYDQQAPDNLSFRDEFVASLQAHGGQLVSIDCDFAAPGFNPVNAVSQAISRGADGMLITPHVDRIEKAIALAQVNRGRLPLFGSPTLYTIKTVQLGQSDFNGLVLPALWHPQAHPTNSFSQRAHQRFGGKVNWRTATAYDATRAIIAALKPGITRSKLQQTLRSSDFSARGSGEDVRFLPSGDRMVKPLLLKVQPSTSGYDFAPIQQP